MQIPVSTVPAGSSVPGVLNRPKLHRVWRCVTRIASLLTLWIDVIEFLTESQYGRRYNACGRSSKPEPSATSVDIRGSIPVVRFFFLPVNRLACAKLEGFQWRKSTEPFGTRRRSMHLLISALTVSVVGVVAALAVYSRAQRYVARQSPPHSFRPGDKVKLKIGGPLILVVRVDGNEVLCKWAVPPSPEFARDRKEAFFRAS